MPTGNNAARGQSAGRRGSLANYTGESAAPASRDMVDADAYLAANGAAAPADEQDQGDVAAAAILETQGNDDAGYDDEQEAEREAARARRREAPAGQAPAVRRAAPPVQQSQALQYSAARELPWKELPGPGRPRNIAHPADILDRRKVERVPLHLSVPAALFLDDRLRSYVFHNRVDVPGDVVGVALDQYLGQQGY